LAKRREQLDAYVSELSGAFLPEHLHEHLCLFVDMKSNLAKAAKAEAGGAASPSSATSGGGGGGGSAAIDSEDSVRKSNWDSSFMNADPLAGLLDVPEPKPAEAEASVAKPKPAQTAAKSSLSSGGGAAVPAAPLPAFLSFG
jgi:hypothetical protein